MAGSDSELRNVPDNQGATVVDFSLTALKLLSPTWRKRGTRTLAVLGCALRLVLDDLRARSVQVKSFFEGIELHLSLARSYKRCSMVGYSSAPWLQYICQCCVSSQNMERLSLLS